MLTLRNLVIVLIVSIGLLGCGKENIDIPNTEEVESIQEHSEIAVEEIDTKEESSVKNIETEETIETEMEQNTDTNPMVDWETFAAQEDNEEICLAILNETLATQKIILGYGNDKIFYPYEEGDKISIPIRNNIQRICYNTVNIDGSLKSEDIEIYWKSEENSSQKYVEFNVGDEAAYNILIFDDNGNMIGSFLISTVAEIE